MLPVTLASTMVPLQVLAAPFVIQLPADSLRNVLENGPSVWTPASQAGSL